MTENVSEYIHLIKQELNRISKEKFTGNVIVSMSMRDGGIGQVNVKIDKNLTLKSAFSAKNGNMKKSPLH
jgi:hypothetical protein